MNYITLKLGGKDRGAKLGLAYLKHLTDVYKCSLDDVFKKLNGMDSVLILPEFIYYSIMLNDKKAGRPVDYSTDDVIEWLDEAGGIKSDAWIKFQESFVSSFTAEPTEDAESVIEEGKKEPLKVAE